MTTTRLDTDEIESTRTEKFLAVILTVFLLVGGIWMYLKIGDWIESDDPYSSMTAQQHAIVKTAEDASIAADQAMRQQETATTALDKARADYEVALQAGDPVAGLKRDYEVAQRQYDVAAAAAASAQARSEKAQDAANQVYQDVEDRADRIHDARGWVIAGLRLLFVGGWIAASFGFVRRLRHAESRYLPLGFATVAAGAVLSIVLAGDYVFDYINPLDLGPIVIAAFGAAVTVLTFVAVQRRLVARIPGRRTRKGECPFCGYPVRDHGPHCEGCGREVIAACATCDQPRRVGTPHCATCGAR
ncbi:zinc ribbon domain-containing protein [Nocardioides jiangxiensis]|uniref:Zinc ribbon domain-containing protein n=1 Tax=Nocardioides jiangxiensis TaxID=3064524 RepID=A0ABT9B544_9ACTN|nr:zinc ribbon domain-containing protein [Nocardioides sp. WY-20]MDO7869368.1 zinc ribbon domain-containing protein [Nocardioides sp. WY-20]